MPFVPLLILVWPFVEIAGFIIVGQQIGVLPTIALALATSALGAALLRQQGTALLAEMRQSLSQGELKPGHLGHGAMISLAAFLLVLPGFVSDVLGLLLFLPPVRSLVMALIARNAKVVVVRTGSRGTVDLNPDEWHRSKAESDVIDAEPTLLPPPKERKPEEKSEKD